MYCGIKLDVSVNSYASALRALEERANKTRSRDEIMHPGGIDTGLGHRRSHVTRVRMLRDESIAFRLYNTDVVTWHPDNSVSVRSWDSKTTTQFANALLPDGLCYGAKERMTFFDAPADADWCTRWSNALVCRAAGTYRQVDGQWRPDEDTIEPMSVVKLDVAAARRISREYKLAAFKLWLFAATPLIRVIHVKTDYVSCTNALLEGDFRRAAEYIPTVDVPRGFGIRDQIKPLPIEGTRHNDPVTLSSVDYVRRWLYGREGAYEVSHVTTMTLPERERQDRLYSQLANARVYMA